MLSTDKVYKQTKEKMEQSKETLLDKYSTMRGGRATPDMVSGIKVECYGSRMPLTQLANISAPEPRLIVIEPWDKSIIKDVEKALLASDLGINPSNDGNLIRVPLPPLTEERREEIAKIIKEWAEETKVAIRNIRREARDSVGKMEEDKEISEDERRRAEKNIQSLTDDYMATIEELREKKVEEIMKV